MSDLVGTQIVGFLTHWLILLFFIPGNLKSLKHFKSEVETIGSGQECGVLIDSETNLIPSETNIQLQTGDTIQCIEIREEDQEIDWLPGF